MQTSHTLKARKRERIGSRYAARERAAGRLPAVIYGHGVDPLHVSLDAKEALRYFHDGERVFALTVEGAGADETVLLKDLQFDYLGSNVVHADLMRVDLNEEIEAQVHIAFVGEAVGLKTAGAIMTHPMTSLAIRCTVAALPDHIDVDVSALSVGQSLHAGEIALPQGVALATDPDAVVASISMVKEVQETGEAAGAAEGAQPEVITEKKEESKDK